MSEVASTGDATTLLNALGHFLGVYRSNYNPNDQAAALTQLQPALKARRTLVIADNLESIFPGGEAALGVAACFQLWDVLLELAKLDAGLLLTSRDTAFGDGRLDSGNKAVHFLLQGLHPDDAYALANRLLIDLGIDRARAPYVELRNLLAQLDHHPLAIQLVLPALQRNSLSSIQTEFNELLPTFVDEAVMGRNRSLRASLEYSLRRLSQEQRTLLSRLTIFEGGASESSLLAIIQIPETTWATLRPALEQAALLTAEQVHEAIPEPFLHFHPVLIPFLRQQTRADEDTELRQAYALWYYTLANGLHGQVFQHPLPVYALIRRELPNLQRALEVWLREGQLDVASTMGDCLATFLTKFGMVRERDQLRHRVENAVAAHAATDGLLTLAEYLSEIGRAEDEWHRGNLQATFTRLTALLGRIQAQPADAEVGPGSFAHCCVLEDLGCCLRDAGELIAAEERFREALSLLDALLKQEPENRSRLILHANLLRNLGWTLSERGEYHQAQELFEQALEGHRSIEDTQNAIATLGQLGNLALRQRDYAQARSRFQQVLDQFRALGEPGEQVIAWYNLGMVAEVQEEWTEAEGCYRESLALAEQLGDTVGAARACSMLAVVTEGAGRPEEAEGWLKGALERIEHVEPASIAHAFYLNNFASLLVHEVRAGRAVRARLAEARRYAEEALHIKAQPGVFAEIWTTFALLAEIAELDEQPEKARGYRRRERESFAAFSGNRYQMDQRYGPLIDAIAAVAQGNAQTLRVQVEAGLASVDDEREHVGMAIQRIWKRERDWHALAEDVGRNGTLLILRVLETLAELNSGEEGQTEEQLIALLPPAIHEAIVQRDEAAFLLAFERLSPKVQQTVATILKRLQW